MFFSDKIHGSRNQWAKMGVALFTIIPGDPPAKFLLSAPMTLCCAGLKILVSEGGLFPPEDNDSIELKVKTST